MCEWEKRLLSRFVLSIREGNGGEREREGPMIFCAHFFFFLPHIQASERTTDENTVKWRVYLSSLRILSSRIHSALYEVYRRWSTIFLHFQEYVKLKKKKKICPHCVCVLRCQTVCS